MAFKRSGVRLPLAPPNYPFPKRQDACIRGRLRLFGLIHRDLRHEIITVFTFDDLVKDLFRLLHGQEKLARDAFDGATIDPQATMAIYADAVRAFSPADVTVSDEISYGPNERHLLRVYEGVNRNPPGGGRGAPVIVLVHGGGFRGGSLNSLQHVATHFAGLGFVAVNITYPLSPEHTWPSGADAVAAAVEWISENISDYRGDTGRIFLMGHSAGGHLALWLGAQSQLSSDSEIKLNGLPTLNGIISLAGIIDLKAYFAPDGCGGNVINLMGGTPESFPHRYRDGTPTSFLPLGIPQVLVQGENDDIVPVDHVISYYDRARSCRDDIKLYMIPDASHRDVISPENSTWLTVLKAINTLM